MTAQIGDIYKYRQKDYRVVKLSGKHLFEPKNYGLETHPSMTACYRGFWCEFLFENDELFLNNLYLFNKDGFYPPLNGVDVSPQEFIEHERFPNNPKKREVVTLPAHFGHRLYKEVHLPINYHGRILIGRNPKFTYYIDGLWDNPWQYSDLQEFVFVDGMLVDIIDQSETARDVRKIIRTMAKSAPESRGTMGTYVQVDLGVLKLISNNAWWLQKS